ncbi:hypothetical protein B0H11DRAFT_2184128 [Mycena galericulata]|nr:hypothetical protein B0H11DRAFT_2184128 [Mycena galericulata]
MASHRPVQRQPSFVKRPREELQEIARETLAAVKRGSYKADSGDDEYPLEDLSADSNSTEYFPPTAFAQWADTPPARRSTPTALACASASAPTPRPRPPPPPPLPGVLNFASATSPGGGFLYGARAQEETLARSSNLHSALASPAAAPFYAAHDTQRAPRYTHALVLARRVRFVRDDAGAWVPPADADVLTGAAVNARAVRKGLQAAGALPRGEEERLPLDVAAEVRGVMRERMARILEAFRRAGVEELVLGSFGTGAFGNEVDAVAGVWAELLGGEGAHFRDVFRRVVFAVIDRETYGVFRDVFRKRKVGFVEDGGK